MPLHRGRCLALLFSILCALTGCGALLSATSSAAVAQGYPNYLDTGTPSLVDLYVDPVSGRDSNDGRSIIQAFKTLTAAWQTIPQGVTLTHGIRINILSGTIPESGIPNFLESRYGTAAAPIIIRSTAGRAATILAGDLNVFDTRYLYLINITLRPNPAGDTFHCEQCSHILLRGSEFDGGNREAHETIKFNQSQYVYIEGSNIHGADDNAIDFVAVQHGHVLGNVIHNSLDWCEYAKGGSADLRVEANEFYDCGTGGFTAGQGTGLEFMSSPWLHYEAYDIKFLNNIVHDTEGAAIGVNGGFNILMAFNTFYRVGSRSHGIEVVFGSRSCDGDTAACQSRISAGGWGVSTVGTEAPIPNRNVTIANNVLYNPAGFSSPFQHFAVYGPRTAGAETNVPSPAAADQNLRITGNVIWNGPVSLPLGIEDSDQGCQDGNPTCNAAQLIAENWINLLDPGLLNPAAGDFRIDVTSGLSAVTATSINSFDDAGRPQTPLALAGDLENSVPYDRSGAARGGTSVPGAYALGSALEVSPPPGSTSPGSGGPETIRLRFGQLSKSLAPRNRVKFTILLTLTGTPPFQLTGSALKTRASSPVMLRARRRSSKKFTLSGSVPHGIYTIAATATAAGNARGVATKKVRL